MSTKSLSLAIFLGIFVLNLCACARKPVEFITWQEEVMLNDKRTIVVSQRRFCDGGPRYPEYSLADCLGREAWLTIDLPEFSSKPIVWHEHLHPMIVNVVQGKLYVVGTPPTQREFELYNEPNPIYIGYVWVDVKWKRIPFNEIPESIYDTNMLITSIPPQDAIYLTLQRKNSGELNGNIVHLGARSSLRIDPIYRGNFSPVYKPN